MYVLKAEHNTSSPVLRIQKGGGAEKGRIPETGDAGRE